MIKYPGRETEAEVSKLEQNLWSKMTIIHTIGKILVVLDHLHEVEMIWHREQWNAAFVPEERGRQ